MNGLYYVLLNMTSFSLFKDKYMEGYWRAELHVRRGDSSVVLAASRKGALQALVSLFDEVRDEFKF